MKEDEFYKLGHFRRYGGKVSEKDEDMKTPCKMDEAPCRCNVVDFKKSFGRVTVEDIAAGMYNACHADCQCSTHPFHADDDGYFDGSLPWGEGEAQEGDEVVQAFRKAAAAARKSLIDDGFSDFVEG